MFLWFVNFWQRNSETFSQFFDPIRSTSDINYWRIFADFDTNLTPSRAVGYGGLHLGTEKQDDKRQKQTTKERYIACQFKAHLYSNAYYIK